MYFFFQMLIFYTTIFETDNNVYRFGLNYFVHYWYQNNNIFGACNTGDLNAVAQKLEINMWKGKLTSFHFCQEMPALVYLAVSARGQIERIQELG